MLSILKVLAVTSSLSAILIACSPPQTSVQDAHAEHRVAADSIGTIVQQQAAAFFQDRPQAVGLSIGITNQGDIHTFHFGTRAPESTERPSDQSIYGIASITKTFTGVLIAKAAHDGKLGVHNDVRQYLDGDYPNLEKEGSPITLVHLLNHTSGLPNALPDRPEMYPDYPEYQDDVIPWMNHISTVYAEYSPTDFLADLRTVALDTIPGTQFGYSNAGAQLAGLILENVYNRPFEVLVDSLVSRPLMMHSTGIKLDEENAQRMMTGYDETGRVMPPVMEAYGAAGALRSTVMDLSRYAKWHLDESDPVVALSHTPPNGQPQDPTQGYATGLNWQMARHDTVRKIWQDGNIPGYSSRIVLYPELNLGLVVLANQLDRSIPGRIDELANSILEAIDERTFALMEAL